MIKEKLADFLNAQNSKLHMTDGMPLGTVFKNLGYLIPLGTKIADLL
jgi:hypothetical protein